MSCVNEKYAELGQPRRMWAIAAVCGDKDRLMTLHDHLALRIGPRDRLIYLGNYLGAAARNDEAVIDELLAFRAALLAKPGMEPTDIVHLRGPAEEAWQRLLRLQFAPAPTRTLETLLDAGAEAYLRLYGVSLNEARQSARAGSVSITRWTNHLRLVQRAALGHEALFCSMRRAAVTKATGTVGRDDERQKILFVPAGFNGARTLDDQADALWFDSENYGATGRGTDGYARIVRGFDTSRDCVNTEGLMVSLDGGCGRGGPLVCGCFDEDGALVEMVTVGGRGAVESFAVTERTCVEEQPATIDRPHATPLPTVQDVSQSSFAF
jgi:hypothetical protein